ncbi:MAG: GTP-binding protein [Candidatus Lokiarchaeota archaeon]|nr:GTP-binding protein [Candidatus Lokiarchaeota archaeon]
MSLKFEKSKYKNDFVSKIVVIGDAAVGKTSLISKYTQGTFNQNYIKTIGAQFSRYDKEVQFEEGLIIYRLLFWDIAGQDDFRFMRPTFYNGANGCIVVYDLTREETLEDVIVWYTELTEFCGDIPAVLFGNKVDLLKDPKDYDDSRVNEIIKNSGISDFYMTSAKTGAHLIEAFNSIIDILLHEMIED